MHREEDSSPCGCFRFKSISPVVQVHMGCRSKHKFTVLYYVALPLSVKNSSLVIETLWTKQAVGFIQFGGFHVVLL